MSAESSPDRDPSAGPTRALIYTPTGRDARLTAEILSKGGFTCTVCATVDDLCTGIEEGAGIVLIAAEGLSPSGMTMLAGTLRAQPPWSDIPLMIFVAQPEMERAARSFEQLGGSQVILLDRPIRVGTLLSTARSALSGRIRQYEIRDLLEELERRLQERQDLLENERASARRLAGLAEASIAIASALSLDEVLKMITDQARRVINASVALTAIRITEDLHDRTVQSVSSADDFDPTSLGWNGGPPESAQASALDLQSMVRLDRKGLEGHPIRRLFDPSSIHAVLAAPLLEREGKRVGVIALGCRDGEFSPEDESVLTQLAQTASAAIQNARLYREAQEANRVKDDFLATLAHELRTPMTGILGWIQMLKLDKSDPADVDRAIAMIESSTTVQARLVEDLLDVSRIIAGKLRIDFSAIELAPIAENVVDTFRARAEEGGVELVSSIDSLPISVFGDEMRLHQVMWNLLSNAVKFTPKGGRVSVSLTRKGSEAILEVADTGRGIAPEFLPHVFERYRQADSTTTRQQAGLGLGLAIVRHLVELHGGQVNVSSDGIDRGTTFTVRLPVRVIRDASLLKEVDSPPEEGPDLSGIKILLVDDESEARDLVSLVLTEYGATVEAVDSVQEAVVKLRRFSPHVIVSDIAMPGEDGYALMRRLREIGPELGRDVPTLALTGYGRPEDRARILASGFQRYVQKPVDPLELAKAVAALLQ